MPILRPIRATNQSPPPSSLAPAAIAKCQGQKRSNCTLHDLNPLPHLLQLGLVHLAPQPARHGPHGHRHQGRPRKGAQAGPRRALQLRLELAADLDRQLLQRRRVVLQRPGVSQRLGVVHRGQRHRRLRHLVLRQVDAREHAPVPVAGQRLVDAAALRERVKALQHAHDARGGGIERGQRQVARQQRGQGRGQVQRGGERAVGRGAHRPQVVLARPGGGRVEGGRVGHAPG
mmetsp:Transcript_22862/g.58265  ORF Transcript_22862/g.58265 Transcript_22862/m.58265 type:complete len:231 (-) Transcript_22862:1591-2283(-)